MENYIYKVSFYDDKYSNISHTDIYYLKAEHTQWTFDSKEIFKIFYIKVLNDSIEYKSAVNNFTTLENRKNEEIVFS
jgi:hypothetical protein